MFKLEQFLRDNIKGLKPYSSARDEFYGPASVFLDANENAYGSTAAESYNRYPDPLQRDLKEKLAEIKEVDTDRIFLGNGSDEVIDLLFRAICRPGQDNVIILPPTYGMYSVCAQLNDVAVKEVPLGLDFRINAEAVLAAVDDHTRLIFVCSPNNPTGNLAHPDSLLRLLQDQRVLVVVDEAYIDYAPEGSMLKFLERFPNLVLLNTFSKAWGLAGLRIGMALADAALVKVLTRIKPPYNISAASQELALGALDRVADKDQMVSATLEERMRMRIELQLLSEVVDVYLSDANFLLVKMQNAGKAYKFLLSRGIVVRDRSSLPGCENCLRITVGTPDENQAVLRALQELEEGS